MVNLFEQVSDKFTRMCQKASAKATAAATVALNDISGSETTEKIGMVVVAVVVVGVLAAAMKRLMPNLFNSIGKTANTKLQGIFDGGYSGGA